MSNAFWRIFCVCYALATLRKAKTKRASVCHGFLAGVAVAFFCLHFLPAVFETGLFYIAAAGVLAGVALGTAVEKRMLHWGGCLFFGLAAVFFRDTPQQLFVTLLQAVIGGVCLYLACGTVLPEQMETKESVLRAAGGIVGFWIGVWLDFGILGA